MSLTLGCRVQCSSLCVGRPPGLPATPILKFHASDSLEDATGGTPLGKPPPLANGQYVSSNDHLMMHDNKFKETARATDAVGRLEAVRERIIEDQRQQEKLRDLVIRGALTIVLIFIVGLAVIKL